MGERAEIVVRPAVAEDEPFIRRVLGRIDAAGAPPWAGEHVDDGAWFGGALAAAAGGEACFLVAQSTDGVPLGALHALLVTDVSGAVHPHISAVAVAAEAEGRGVGTSLIRAGEAWARAGRWPFITLHVYVGNAPARRLYQKLGYEEEWLRLRRALSPSDGT